MKRFLFVPDAFGWERLTEKQGSSSPCGKSLCLGPRGQMPSWNLYAGVSRYQKAVAVLHHTRAGWTMQGELPLPLTGCVILSKSLPRSLPFFIQLGSKRRRKHIASAYKRVRFALFLLLVDLKLVNLNWNTYLLRLHATKTLPRWVCSKSEMGVKGVKRWR